MPAQNEQTLIARSREGDHAAFRELVERHMRKAYDIAFSIVRDHDDSDDIAQEAFVRVYQSLSGFREHAGFGTWLYRIVTNISLDRIRKRKRTVERTEPIDRHAERLTQEPEPMYSADLQLHIERALYSLPTLQRAVVILRHLDGLSTRHVSSILRCSEGTVKTHLHRGLKKMKTLLRNVKEESE